MSAEWKTEDQFSSLPPKLCTQCWTPKYCEHFPRPEGTPKPDNPEYYQPLHLCVLCARTWAPLSSRWSWLACPNCKLVNRQISMTFGLRHPLGRHSIMNGGAVNLYGISEALREKQLENLENVTRGWNDLFAWNERQAKDIQATLMPEEYRQAAQIPTDVWVAHSQPSFEASCAAWLAFGNLGSFADLHWTAMRLCELGELEYPDPLPARDWEPSPDWEG